MADNVTLPGTGAVVATDDVGGVQYQLVKLATGADGAAALVSASAPLPVSLPARTLNVAAGTAATSGDNTLVAAPGSGQRLVLAEVQLQLEAAAATVGLLKDGAAGSTLLRWRGVSDGDGVIKQLPIDARLKLTTNTALVLNLSAANQVGYTIYYYAEAV